MAVSHSIRDSGWLLTAILRDRSGRRGGRAAEEAIEEALPQFEYFASFEDLEKAWGSAGDGLVWHHIVEQRPINVQRFRPESIHNTGNVVAVPREVNQAIADYYSSKRRFTNGQKVRDWLVSQSFTEQLDFGMNVLLSVLAGEPLP